MKRRPSAREDVLRRVQRSKTYMSMDIEERMEGVIRSFVGSLTEPVCRDQLIRAYLQMERCRQVLHGMDVEPIEMKDNGLSTDLELFYQCRKIATELEYLNDMISRAAEDGEE